MQLIVLGMHRSGTSIVARLLNLMGAYFGPEGASLGASNQNPKGFWERRDVIELNDLLIRSAGCEWNRPLAFAASAVPEADLAAFQERASRLLLDLDAHRPWMVKEPRFCLTLPVWRPLLEVPIGIHVVRHPVEVASSLRTRNDIAINVGLELWDFYTRNAIAATAEMPHVVVSHHALVEKPVEAVEELFHALAKHRVAGLRMPNPQEITAFISLELYRERATREDLVIFNDAPQVDLYQRLIATSRASVEQLPLVPTYGCLAAYERAVAKPLPALIEAEKIKQEFAAAKAAAVTELAKRDERIKSLEQAVERGTVEGKTATAALQSEVAKRDERIKSLEQAVERGAVEGKTATAALQSEVAKRDERIKSLEQAVERGAVEGKTATASLQSEVAKRDERIKALEQAVERGGVEGKTATAALQSEVAKRDERIKSLEQAVERGGVEGKTATAALQSEVGQRDEQIQVLRQAVEQANVELQAALELLVKHRQHAEALDRNIAAVQQVAFVAARTSDAKIRSLEQIVERSTIEALREAEASRTEVAERDARIGALEEELRDNRERSSVCRAASAEQVAALKRALDIALADGKTAVATLQHEVATRDERIEAMDRDRLAASAEVSEHNDRIAALERDVANAVAASRKQHEHVMAVDKKLQACETSRLMAEEEVRTRGEEAISLRASIRDLEVQLLRTTESLNARENTVLSLKADRDEGESRVRLREQELAGVARQIAECQDRCGSHKAEAAEVTSALQRAELRLAQQQWSLSLAVREVLALRQTPGVWAITQLAESTDRFILGLPSRYPLMAAASLVKNSGFFDEAWYCGQHRDVATSGLAPVLHYLCIGAARMSDPGPNFKSVAYLTANPDVAVAGDNPLLHYIVNGKAEGRSIG